MDGKRFVFDLQRFTEVTITETSTGSGKYKVDDSSTEYDSLDKAINAANVKFSVTTSNETKYYDAADDFNKNNNLNEATGVNIYGDVTLQDNAEVDLGTTISNVIKVAGNATLNLGAHTLTIKRTGTISLSENSYTSPVSAIVVKNGVTFNVEGTTTTNNETGAITGGTIKYDWDPSSSNTLDTIKQGRTSAAIQVGEKVGTYTDDLSTTDKATFNMKSGIITSKSTAISMSDNAVVNISGGKTESEKSCGIYYGNTSPGGGQINISGGLLQSGSSSKLPAIQVSGSVGEGKENPGAEITISGGTVAFTNNGYDPTATPTDYFKDTGKPVGNPDAIYAGGKTKLTISGGNITSTGTGVELRAGSLDFTGGSVTSTATTYKAKAASTTDTSGGQTFGAAIAVTQHTTNQSLTVNISGENTKASGAVALTIENTTDSKDENSSIAATISGGTLESTDAAAIAAKAADSRSSITIDGDVTFVGQLETTFAETSTSEEGKTTGITITPKATVTIQEKVVDEAGNVTYETVETFDSSSLKFNIGDSSASNYVVVNEGWNSYNSVYKPVEENASKTANSFIYLTKKTAGEAAASLIVTLAPKEVGESGSEPDSTEILALTTELTTAFTGTVNLDLNDTLFSSLFGETSKFKTLDASAITQVSTTTEEGDNVVTTQTDWLKLNITGNANIESIVGSEGNDTLTAGSVGSALNGGKGDDLLIGGSGPDTFLFSEVGNGSDSIQGYETSDTVSLGSGLTPATSFDKVSYNGSDYVVSLGNSTTDSLTFKSTEKFVLQKTEGNKVITYSYAPGSIVSGEGVTIGSSYYKSKTFNGNSGDNAVFQTIDGSAVEHAIRITGNSNANSITGSKYGGTLLGGDANDTLVATSVGTYLNGGDEDDLLVGYGNGGNVFIYTGGDDKIKNYTTENTTSGNEKAQDLVSVASGINVTSATVTTTEGTGGATGNLVITFDNAGSLTFEEGASSTISLKSGKKYYTFSASSIASAADKSITLTAGYDPTTDTNKLFDAGDTYNTVDAHLVNKGAISIKGNDEANYIIGGSSGGSLSGLAGNDTLVGGKGNDIFHYTEGKDVIVGFKEGGTDLLSIDTGDIVKAKASSRKLTFTMNNKANTLVFRATDAAPTQISLASDDGNNAYLTKDGVVSLPSDSNKTKSLKLFSSAKGRIDLNNDTLYSGKEIASVSAESVTKQSVTLVGGSNQNATFTFATNNKKRDGFEYNGGKVTIGNYESGKDKLNLGDFTISGFEVKPAAGSQNQNASDVVISLGSDDNVISLTGAAGSEMLIHQATNRGNSYSKMVFDETGVVYDKAKTKATNATIWGGMTANSGYSAENTKVKKITVKDISVANISLQAGGNNTVIDASAAGADVSLYSGAKNDKFIGSGEADMFVYTAGKDIIQGFGTGDSISLSGGTANKLALTDAKITSGKKSIKFKFEGGNKNTLTIKPIKNETLSGPLYIDNTDYTYGKNFIASNGNVSLTSQFGGTYNIAKSKGSTIDGHLVSKKLTFKGTDAAESLVGGQNKTTFKGGGGPNSGAAADTLVGGSGKDTFFYAKGDKGDVTIEDFDFSNDKLKIAGGTINKIESLGSDGGIQFAMKNGRGDSPAVGWFKVTTSAKATDYNNGTPPKGTTITPGNVLIKANNTYYWFAQGGETLASSTDESLQKAKIGDLITWDKKVSKSDIDSSAAVIELNYSTNLVKAGVASVVSSSNAIPTKS